MQIPDPSAFHHPQGHVQALCWPCPTQALADTYRASLEMSHGHAVHWPLHVLSQHLGLIKKPAFWSPNGSDGDMEPREADPQRTKLRPAYLLPPPQVSATTDLSMRLTHQARGPQG